MVYECENCKKPLPPNVTGCPACGLRFPNAVPADARAYATGFRPANPTVVRPPKTIAVALWFIFFFPVGLWLLWRHPGWSMKTKQYVTGAFAAYIIIGLTIGATSSSKTVASSPDGLARSSASMPAAPVEAASASSEQSNAPLRRAVSNDFSNAKYARAYDQFGKQIMRRDHDVKEVSEARGSGGSFFYVMVREDRLPQSRAAARAGRYMAEFVAMRERFFGPTEARGVEMTLYAADNTTMASADADGAKANCTFYDTCK